MAKGLRFFGTDYNNIALEPSVTVSSGDTLKNFMFDGLLATKWTSIGEGTDGSPISVEIEFSTSRTINCLYVYSTNIEDITFWYDDGGYVEITSSNATITKSSDGYHVFVKLNTNITTSKLKITGEDTIVENQDKYITEFYSFLELGQFNYFPDFSPKIDNTQNVFKLDDGRNFIIERGESFEADITFKSHINQADITLIETLLARKEPFFIWPNGGDETLFIYKFKPFRFQDIFKVAISGDNSPEFTRNYYKSGYNNKIKVIQVP